VRTLGACALHLAAALALAPRQLVASLSRTQGRVLVVEPFARLEEVAPGVLAVVSTPFGGARTTLANGGLIVGRTGVVAVEGFFEPAGAAWLARQALALTGRLPTHVVLTHYHADHANGVAGYQQVAVEQATKGIDPPALLSTATTRELAAVRNQPADAARSALLADVTLVPADAGRTIDLGDRRVRLVPREGHTPSDVTVEVDEPRVVFAGDLLWSGVLPNYVDAIPSRLRAAAAALAASGARTFVPGHGGVTDAAGVARYLAVLDEIEGAARAAWRTGTPAADAARQFRLSPTLGEWTVFNASFVERAFTAWGRELGGR
jgi:glyoxylase-like metal-dependent hydrolase (beta-lactamase superfamily II)